jgi:hypothetical protein
VQEQLQSFGITVQIEQGEVALVGEALRTGQYDIAIGAFGWPDLNRVDAKILLVAPGEPVPEIIALPILSLTLPSGLKNSSFTNTSASRSLPSLLSRISGVCPIVLVMLA